MPGESCCWHRMNVRNSKPWQGDERATIDAEQRPMATVRQSIAALYEQSQKSASEGAAMFAVIESEPALAFDIEEPSDDRRPPITRRFDDLRDLAEREMLEDSSPPADAAKHQPADVTIASIDSDHGSKDISPAPDTAALPRDTEIAATAPDMSLPSEPPAPAAGDTMSDFDVADIQELVRQAWEDETALGNVDSGSADLAPGAGDANGDETINGGNDAPDITAAMEDIAAAVVKSGDTPALIDLDAMKADLVAAMRAELQAVVAADLRPMIKAAIAEALQELPAAKPTTRPKKAASGASAKKKASSRAKKAAATQKSKN